MILKWAWKASRHADTGLRMRLKFVAGALREPVAARTLANAEPDSSLGRLLTEWPAAVGFLQWPYQCASWDRATRVTRIVQHLEVIEQIPGLQVAGDDKVIVADLSSFSPDTSLLLDRAPWLAREGLLTLSLFKGDFRAFTVSFSLSGFPDSELFIGGLQGRQSDDALSLYRDLTKDFEGMRPRDFMLEMLRLFAIKIGVRRIHAIADDHKIWHHEYFDKKQLPGLSYDDVWIERNGERVAETHFELPIQGSRKPLEAVAPKKRSMYRRRYEMLETIERMLPTDLTKADRKHFEAT